jgi:hypothetical protein
MQFLAKYPSDPVGSHETKIKFPPGLSSVTNFETKIIEHLFDSNQIEQAPTLQSDYSLYSVKPGCSCIFSNCNTEVCVLITSFKA